MKIFLALLLSSPLNVTLVLEGVERRGFIDNVGTTL
jgi:hypothetical protein